MPENVAKEILPRLNRPEDIPAMSLSIDEYTGSAGFVQARSILRFDATNEEEKAKDQTQKLSGKDFNI